MVKRNGLLLLIIFIAALLSGSVHAQVLDKVSIQFKWFHQFQFAGYYAAKEKGFFAEEGLDVDLIEYVANGDPVKEVVEGRATYGISDAGLLRSRYDKAPVVLVGQIFQHSPVVILALRQSNLRTPYDLAGRSVMTYLQGQGDASLKAMVRKALGSVEKVDWREHTYRFEDVIEKKVDAMLAYSTNEPYWFHEQGAEVTIIDPRDYGIDFYGDNLFTSKVEVSEHPDRVNKVLQATIKGWNYALDHPEEIIDLILAKYNTQNKTRPHLEFEARQTAELIDRQFFKVGSFEASRYGKIAGIYQQLQFIEQPEVPPGFFWQDPDAQLVKAQLSDEEQEWVKSHTVRVGVEEWPPIVFTAKDGKAGGIAGGYLDLVAQRTGLQFKIVSDIWDTLLTGLRTHHTIDLLPATYFTEERTTFGLYSKPYFLSKEFIYVLAGNQQIRSLDDLAKKKIAMIKGYGTIAKLKAYLPQATIVETKNLLESINLVLNGDADALVEAQMAMLQILRANSIVGLKGISQNNFPASPLHLFSRMDEPLLQSILQKGLDTITADEAREIQRSWVNLDDGGDNKRVELSLDEEQWLAKHPHIHVGDDFVLPPFSFRDEEGNLSGIASSYLERISKRLHVEMRPVWGLSWQQVIEKVKSGGVDLLPVIVPTSERELYLNFTKPYISFPIVIATHMDGAFIDNLDDLKGRKVGVVDGYITGELLAKEHADLQLVYFKTVLEGMKALESKQVEAFIENLGSLSYLIEQQKFTQIKIAAPTDYRFELAIGVRKDWPELVPMLNKALDSIDDNEKKAIKNTWMAIQVQLGMDLISVLLWVVPGGLGAGVIILIIVMANRRMVKEIALRKQVEDELRKLTCAITESPAAVLITDSQGAIEYVNPRFCQTSGYTPEEVMGRNPRILQSGHTPLATYQALWAKISSGKEWRGELLNKRKNGELFWELASISAVKNDAGVITNYVTVKEDITERKRSEKILRDTMEVIAGSIQYASRIQRAILPSHDQLAAFFSDYFIVWEPRDVVGGDLYWFENWGAGSLFILADCTGHGVPGAFMTLIANGALEQALKEIEPGDVGALVTRMHQLIQTWLGQDGQLGDSDDGLELGACYIPESRDQLIFVGARFSLFVLDPGGQVEEVKGEKKGIAYRHIPYLNPFTNQVVNAPAGRRFYMTSDGLTDQLGGQKQLGFGKKRFMALLAGCADLSIMAQGEKVTNALIAYQGQEKRRDDLSFVGFAIDEPTTIAWRSDLAVGHKEIDADHRKLFSLVNDLIRAGMSPYADAILGGVLNTLISYTQFHFQREESLMALYAYPQQVAHTQEHEKLIAAALVFKQRFDAGERATLIAELEKVLKGWLMNHITKVDLKLGEFLNQSGCIKR